MKIGGGEFSGNCAAADTLRGVSGEDERAMSAEAEVGLLPRILRLLTFRLPLRSGYGRLSNGGPLPGLPWGRWWAPLRDGGRIHCYLDDYIGNSLFYFGDLDAKVSWVVKRSLAPGDTFLDIGANVGILSILGSRLVGDQGRVLAVEPNPGIADMLVESLEVNGCSNVTVGRYALGEEEGELPLSVPRRNLGGASLGAPGGDGIVVPVKTLRSVLEEEGIGTPRMVKLDVEGFEVSVLKGILEVWKQESPEVILFEHLGREEVADSEVGRMLSGLGYCFFRIPRNWFRVRLMPDRKGINPGEVTHDVVAVRPGSPACARLGVDA